MWTQFVPIFFTFPAISAPSDNSEYAVVLVSDQWAAPSYSWEWVSSSLPLLVLFWPMHVHIHSAQKQLGFCVALFVEYLFSGTRWQLRSPWWQCALTQCHNIHHWSGDQVQVIRWKTKQKTTAKTTQKQGCTSQLRVSSSKHFRSNMRTNNMYMQYNGVYIQYSSFERLVFASSCGSSPPLARWQAPQSSKCHFCLPNIHIFI